MVHSSRGQGEKQYPCVTESGEDTGVCPDKEDWCLVLRMEAVLIAE